MRSAKKFLSWPAVLLCGAVLGCQGKLGAGVTGATDGQDGPGWAGPGERLASGDGDSGSSGGPQGDGDGDGDGAGGPGETGAGDGDGDGDSSMAGLPEACAGVVFQSSGAPLRRLSAREYRYTVIDLFDGVGLPSVDLVPDARVAGFDNAAAGQAVSSLAVERYAAAAAELAAAAVAERAGWAPCTDNTPACVQETLLDLAARAYRHPLSQAERGGITDLATGALALGTPEEALVLGIEALLQSPAFLYRPELGTGVAVGGGVALTGVELASRLSYFLTASMPDDALMAAAIDGGLSTPAGLRAEAEGLLTDPRARPVLTDFFVQWLGLYRIDDLQLDPALYPEAGDDLRRDLRASAEAYIAHALFDQDSWRLLMSGSYGYVNDRLAPLFGVPAPGTDKLTYTELDDSERRGILTQPSMLAATSHGIRHSPILRGVRFLNHILCAELPAPPADALNQEAVMVDPSLVCTTRDEVAMMHTSKPGCANCHDAIDAAGFNFENYDALGRYRTLENGCPVDATGSYPGSDLEGTFTDAVALAEALPDSEMVAGCVAEHLFRFGLGRRSESADECEVASLGVELLNGGDSLRELVVALVMTPSFRSRPAI